MWTNPHLLWALLSAQLTSSQHNATAYLDQLTVTSHLLFVPPLMREAYGFLHRLIPSFYYVNL